MTNRAKNTNTSRFQITFSERPSVDNKQVVFGQLVPDPDGESPPLHPLHWVEGMGTASGDPREAVIIEDCGECGSVAPVPGEKEEARYSRAGIRHVKLEDAIETTNIDEVLELTQETVENLRWQCKKVTRDNEARGSTAVAAVESDIKTLKAVLEMVEYRAGQVKGFENKSGRSAKSQLIEVREMEDQL